jgi:hypothetical protein
MLAALHRWATAGWMAIACGAGVGFVARDLAGAGQPWVALAWTAGAGAGALLVLRGPPGGEGPRPPGAERPPPPRADPRHIGRSEDGQSTIEWTGLVLMMALALGALFSAGPHVDGRSFGGFLAHHFTCAVKGGCRDGDRALARAYGERTAALVREHAPGIVYEPGERQIPVDWRHCRRPVCANARDERGLDVHRSDAGEQATVFTRVLRRGGRTYLQYWLYYPDSNTTWAGSDKVWEAAWLLPRLRGLVRRAPPYPGYHRDDWEAYVVRLDPDGGAWVRASSHGHWQGCKEAECRNEWTARTGWTRVSRGSHAGHIPLRSERRWSAPHPSRYPVPADHPPRRTRRIPLLPGHDLDERTTTGEGLRLIPLETHDRRRYRPNAEGIEPPWRKRAYHDPESDGS